MTPSMTACPPTRISSSLELSAHDVVLRMLRGGVLATESGHAKQQALSLRPSALNLIDARTRRVVERVGYGKAVNVGDTWSDVAVSGRSGWAM